MASQRGQVLLIVILVIIIASTIGLSLASRSITSLRTSTEEAESQKALAFAEAGIERAIQGNVPVAVEEVDLGKSNYSTTVTQVQSSSFLINGGNLIPKDEGSDVWFAKHDDVTGNPIVSTALSPNPLYLYWGSSSEKCGTANAPAAIEAIIVTNLGVGNGQNFTFRFAYDPCKSERGNNFALPDIGNFVVGDKTFRYGTPQAGPNDLLKGGGVSQIVFMRVVPIYKDTVVGVSTCSRSRSNCIPLPSQGYVITSTGKSGDASRKITVFKGYPQTYLPYLSYGLFVAN